MPEMLGAWQQMQWPEGKNSRYDTGVEISKLQEVGQASVAVPQGFVNTLLCIDCFVLTAFAEYSPSIDQDACRETTGSPTIW